MHGHAKVSGKELEVRKKERVEKLKSFQDRLAKANSLRECKCYDSEALELTRILLQANSDFYNMWNFRKEIIQVMTDIKQEEELESFYKNELIFLENCLKKNPKSYGTWHHRCWILNRQPNPDWKTEQKLCDKCLQLDERNFHCWDYRRFVAEQAKIALEEELEFTTNKIKRNFSNYSAWHYRSKLLPQIHPNNDSNGQIITQKVLENELEMIQHACYTDPNDQSAWFYHRWLLGRNETPPAITHVYISRNSRKVIVSFSKPILINDSDPQSCKLSIVSDNQVFVKPWENSENNSYPSVIWSFSFSPITVRSMDRKFEVTMTMNNNVFSTGPLVLTDKKEVSYINDLKDVFSFNYAAVSKFFLEKQKTWCQELLEVEPDSKWTMLSVVLLLRVLDAAKYLNDIELYFNKLIHLDPDRSGYYKDLRSKFLVEDAILDAHQKDTRHFSLTHKALTGLYHMQFLCLMIMVDLSDNEITSLASCSLLECVENLVLNNNHVKSCQGLQKLEKLQHLSLKNNEISTVKALKPLISCKSLRFLELTGNPLTEADYTLILAMFPNLYYLDDRMVTQVQQPIDTVDCTSDESSSISLLE